MAEQNLDHANINFLLEQMSRKTVPQRVRRHPFGNLCRVSGGMDNAVELARGEMVDRVLSGKQPAPGPLDPPPVTQQLEQLWGEHREAVLAALCVREIYVASIWKPSVGEAPH